MGDPLINMNIKEVLCCTDLTIKRQTVSTNAVIDRFRRSPEQYLYFMATRHVYHTISQTTVSTTDLSMTPVDIDGPASRRLQPIESSRVPCIDTVVESASSGLFVGVLVTPRALIVVNPLTGDRRTILFPTEVNADDQIGPVRIFVKEKDATYAIWFYVYHRNPAGTSVFLYRSATGQCIRCSCTAMVRLFLKDVLVIDRDVSAYWIQPLHGRYYFKYMEEGLHSVGPITPSEVPQGYYRVPWFVPNFSHFAFIAGGVWAFQPEVMNSLDTGDPEEVCFISILCMDETVAVNNEQQQQQYRLQRMRWCIRHTLQDERLLDLVFDRAGVVGMVSDDRILVTADSGNFFVCARNDARVLRVNVWTGRVDEVLGNGVLSRTRDRVFAVTASFIAP